MFLKLLLNWEKSVEWKVFEIISWERNIFSIFIFILLTQDGHMTFWANKWVLYINDYGIKIFFTCFFRYHDTIECYDPIADNWEIMGEMQTSRSWLSCVSMVIRKDLIGKDRNTTHQCTVWRSKKNTEEKILSVMW